MAMSGSASGPDEWVQLYQRTLAGRSMVAPPRVLSMFGQAPAVSEATVVTTTSSTPGLFGTGLGTGATTPGPFITRPGTSASTHSGESGEGLSGRPIRRRSRSTRRAPTTVLNTDLSNFRAMVQQFTGIPTTPFSSAFRVGGPVRNFGFNQSRVQPSLPQYHFHHQQQQQQQQQQPGEGVYSMGQIDGVFLSGFNNPRSNMEVPDDRFESLSSQNNNTGGGYIV